jgi:hypothetical protein
MKNGNSNHDNDLRQCGSRPARAARRKMRTFQIIRSADGPGVSAAEFAAGRWPPAICG